MGVVNDATITAIRKGFSRLYQRGIQSAQSKWKRIAVEVPSGDAVEVHGWIGRFPQMKEWKEGAKRQLRSIAEGAYQLPNKKFEATIDLPVTAIEDDRIGVYGPLAETMGQESMDHLDRGVFAALNDAATLVCSDGKTFFATDHPRYAEVDRTGTDYATSNIVHGSPSDPALSGEGTGTMTAIGDVLDGRSYRVKIVAAGKTGTATFVVSIDGADYPADADAIATAAAYKIPGTDITIGFTDANASPTNSFKADDVWSFSTPTPWYLLHTKNPVKPLIYQRRTPAEFQAITDRQQSQVFMSDAFLYGVRARRAFGVGFWQMAVACGAELTESNFDTTFQTMQEIRWDGGDPTGFSPDLLVCGPRLRADSNTVIKMQYAEGMKSNPNYMAVDVECTPWLLPLATLP
ncbi:MAG: Mu-like prophage major head subunit gpT family protein [Spirochaetaceae bacterium]|nr:Mu-like prophage major head subunit gpT family protein [Spirochaetaceae bacterium]